jgi:YHS domain-containing protein
MRIRKAALRGAAMAWIPLAVLFVALSAQAEQLERVEAKRVCMVNDTVFPKDQIAVQVEGKTYYGCCEMCKGRLAADAAVRQSTDPVSGKKVDKATAVIGAGSDGKVRYFESEETFTRFGNGA